MYGDRKWMYLGGGVLLLLLLLGGGFLLFSKKGGASSREGQLAAAREYSVQGDYQEALAVLEALLGKDPQDADALFLRDQILAGVKIREENARKERELQQKEQEIKNALDAFPEGSSSPDSQSLQDSLSQENAELLARASSFVQEGKKALARKNYNQALALADQALEIIPAYPAALALKNDVARQRREGENPALTAQAAALVQDGQKALKKKNYNQALALADQALKVLPGYSPALTLKEDTLRQRLAAENAARDAQASALVQDGQKALKKGNYSEALTLADQALKVLPSYPGALALKEEVPRQRREAENAALAAQASALVQDGEKALKKKNYNQAQTLADQALEVLPGYPPALSLKKDILGQRREAENAALEDRASALVQEGEKALKKGNYNEALTLADQALKVLPGYPEALALKEDVPRQRRAAAEAQADALIQDGEKALKKGNYSEALTLADQALKVLPGYPGALALKEEVPRQRREAENAAQLSQAAALTREGEKALKKGDYAAALQKADQALGILPGYGEALALKEDTARQRREAENAAQLSRAAALTEEGKKALKKGDYAAALEKADQALGVFPGYGEALALQEEVPRQRREAEAAAQLSQAAALTEEGRKALKKEDYAGALQKADQALGVLPGYGEALTLKEDTARQQREAKDAALMSQASALTAEGEKALKAGDYPQALGKADQALGILPDYPEALALKANTIRQRREAQDSRLEELLEEAREHLQAQRWSPARDSAQSAQDLAAANGEAHRLEGEGWYLDDPENGTYRDKAQEAYGAALEREPEDHLSHFRMGQIAVAEGELPQGILAFEEAVKFGPREARYYFELGKAYYRARSYDKARQAFEKVSTLEPGLEGNWFNLGLTYLKLQRNRDAERVFSSSAQARPEHDASFYEWGRVRLLRENYTGAAEVFSTAARLAPERPRNWRGLGAAAYETGEFSQASEAYEKALALEPEHAPTLHNLALLALEDSRPGEALKKAADAVKIDGSNAVYYYTLGQAAEARQMGSQAISAYKKSADLDRNYLKPRINLGVLYDLEQEYDRALQYLLEALDIDPDSSAVWNNLGKVYLHKGEYQESLLYFEKAVKALPGDVEIRFNLALALIEKGETTRAEDELLDILSTDPFKGDAYDQLARLQILSGRRGAALKTIASLEKVLPGHSTLEELKRLAE